MEIGANRHRPQRRNQAMNAGSGNTELYIEDERQQRAGLFLRDVAYRLRRTDPFAQNQRSLVKYTEMFARRAAKGQCVDQPYLGCREFAAVSGWWPTTTDAFLDKPAIWAGCSTTWTTPTPPTRSRAFRAEMKNGVILVPPFETGEVKSRSFRLCTTTISANAPPRSSRTPASLRTGRRIADVARSPQTVTVNHGLTRKGKEVDGHTSFLETSKTSGVAASLLWDAPSMSTSIDTRGKPERVAEQHADFRARINALPESAQADAGLKAVQAYLDKLDPERLAQEPTLPSEGKQRA